MTSKTAIQGCANVFVYSEIVLSKRQIKLNQPFPKIPRAAKDEIKLVQTSVRHRLLPGDRVASQAHVDPHLLGLKFRRTVSARGGRDGTMMPVAVVTVGYHLTQVGQPVGGGRDGQLRRKNFSLKFI